MFSSERQPTIFRLRSGSEGFNVLLKFDCRARIEEEKGRRRYILLVALSIFSVGFRHEENQIRIGDEKNAIESTFAAQKNAI
jgi:hypothetical protein